MDIKISNLPQNYNISNKVEPQLTPTDLNYLYQPRAPVVVNRLNLAYDIRYQLRLKRT